jgi:heptosyltransferase-2
MTEQPTKPHSILIRAPNWVGDVVMATPAFRAVRNTFPDARISLLIKKYGRCVINDAPWFDEVIEYDPSGEHRGMRGYLKLVGRLRRGRFDLALILVNSLRGALEARLAGARRRVGYDRNGRRMLLTDAVPPPAENGKIVPQNMVEYYLRLCSEIGCPPEPTREELFVRNDIDRQAEEFLARHGRDASKMLVGINPGAAFGSSKCWLPERFAQVADAIIERRNCDLFICSAPAETEIARAIESHMKRRPINPHNDNPGLEVYKGIIRRMRLLITNDTGARHIAVAFGVPVVVVFGSTSTRYTDVNLEQTTIVTANVQCAPCQEKTCPTGTHECMRAVTVDMLMDAVEQALSDQAE